MNASRSQKGFTLLEALVALVLIAVTLVPLYEWVGRSLGAAAKMADTTKQAEAQLAALAVISRINPLEQANGTSDAGPYRVRWQSTPKVEPVDNVAYPRGIGLFQVALYDVRAQVLKDGAVWFEFQVDQVGYRRVRSPMVFQAPPPQR